MAKDLINSETPEKTVVNNLEKQTTTTTEEKISVESPSLKDKILMRTDKIGATQNGKIAKGFIAGILLTLLSIWGYNKAKEKGLIKIK